MKKLFLLASVAVLTLSSFTTANSLTSNEDVKTVPCKWRTCITQNGVKFCTEWTSGNCNVTESGQLLPIE